MKKRIHFFSEKSLFKKIDAFKKEKDGAIIIEFMMFLPIFFFLLWVFVNVSLLLFANFQMAQAANEGAQNIVKMMRGSYEIELTESDINMVGRDIQLMVNQMGVVRMYKDGNTPEIVLNDKDACEETKREYKEVICAYVTETTSNGRVFQKITLDVQSGFVPIGNYIPGVANILYVKGTGVAEKEFAGRYQYVE